MVARGHGSARSTVMPPQLEHGVAVARGARRRDDEALGELHHVVVVGERLVRLEHRELGVVAGVDALVAEHATDLEHPLEPADHESLEVQLERDAKVEVDVERVVVRDERSRGRAAELVVEHGGLHLGETQLGELPADRRHRGEPHREDAPGVVVHDQVDVALPEAGVDVGETVPLVGQRAEGLGQELERRDLHRQLALTGGHHRAVDAHPVAQVELRRTRRARRRPARAADTNSWIESDWSRTVANVSLP